MQVTYNVLTPNIKHPYKLICLSESLLHLVLKGLSTKQTTHEQFTRSVQKGGIEGESEGGREVREGGRVGGRKGRTGGNNVHSVFTRLNTAVLIFSKWLGGAGSIRGRHLIISTEFI